MTGTDIRVVIADDHPVVRDGLSALLASVPFITVAGLAANGREAVQAAVTLRPDVLVMDVQMPELTGVDAAGEISRVAPDVAVLMLTMFDDDYSVLAAMRAGARGYVLKGAQQDEIVRAIAAVAAGEAIFGPGVARMVLGLVASPPTAEEPFGQLTGREREVLDLIAAGARNAEIARRMSIAPKTVANHISAIFTKLQIADRGEAIILARDAGLGRLSLDAMRVPRTVPVPRVGANMPAQRMEQRRGHHRDRGDRDRSREADELGYQLEQCQGNRAGQYRGGRAVHGPPDHSACRCAPADSAGKPCRLRVRPDDDRSHRASPLPAMTQLRRPA